MNIKNSFNKAAHKYDDNCQLQLETGDTLLSLISSANNVIDLGCGSGITTEKLKYKNLYALDISNELLALARLRLGKKDITYLEMGYDDFSGLNLDLAFANMSLQWSDDLELSLNNIKKNLNTTGVLAFSIPLSGTFSDLKTSTMSFLSAAQVKELLSSWEIIHSKTEEINYLFPNLIEALKSIKSVGANYCKDKKYTLPSRDKSPYLLKYNIGYFIARKKVK